LVRGGGQAGFRAKVADESPSQQKSVHCTGAAVRAEKKRGGSGSPPSKRRVLGRNSESDARYAFLGGQTDVISRIYRASKIPNPEWCLGIAD